MWGSLKSWEADAGPFTWRMDINRSTQNRMSNQQFRVNTTTVDHGFYSYKQNGWLHTKRIAPYMTTDKYVEYAYDALGRVSHTIDPAPNNGLPFESYTYDNAGNLTQFDHIEGSSSPVLWTYATPPQFGEIPSRTAGTTTDTHTWDPVTGRMTAWDTTVNGSLSVERSFEYDGAGRLVQMTRKDPGTTGTKLFYDVDDALVYEERDNQVYERFQGHRRAPDDTQIEQVLPQIRVETLANDTQVLRFAYIDVDGQAVSVYDYKGNLESREVSGAYGVPFDTSAAAGRYQGSDPWTYQGADWEVDGLHGQEEDRENEVMHFGTRHTMFRDGMWLQPEPLLHMKPRDMMMSPLAAGGVYAGGNPILLEDVSGLRPKYIRQAIRDVKNPNAGGIRNQVADPVQAKDVKKALVRVAKTETGAALINSIADSGHTATVQVGRLADPKQRGFTAPADLSGKPTDSEITISESHFEKMNTSDKEVMAAEADPSTFTASVVDTVYVGSGKRTVPNQLEDTLGHEISHAETNATEGYKANYEKESQQDEDAIRSELGHEQRHSE